MFLSNYDYARDETISAVFGDITFYCKINYIIFRKDQID